MGPETHETLQIIPRHVPRESIPPGFLLCPPVHYLRKAVIKFLEQLGRPDLETYFFQMGVFTFDDLVTLALTLAGSDDLSFERQLGWALEIERAEASRLAIALHMYARPLEL